jgi:hypothetical protein
MKKKIFFMFFFMVLIISLGFSKPKYYISIGYGNWSLNLLKSTIEDKLDDLLRDNLQDSIKSDYPSQTLGDYSQNVNFDSSGGGVNFQIRIYPGGEKGSFSLGFSYFRVDSKIIISADIRQNFTSGDYIASDAEGNLIVNYSAFAVDLKWDLLVNGKIHPYISFGGGIAPLKGNMDYYANGAYYSHNKKRESYTISNSDDLTEIDDIKISYLPIIIINFGVRVDIIKNGSLFLDAGIWNGFMVKGGIAYTF